MKSEFRGIMSFLSRPLQLIGLLFLFTLMAELALSGCSYNMSRQPRYSPMSSSNFFPDRRSVRPVVEGAVASDQRYRDSAVYTGRMNGIEVATVPLPMTMDLLKRGRERFDINCSPCHSRLGNGEGMVVQRGFAHPPTYHSDRLRQAPDGHFFAVITEGFGRMHSYANRVDIPERWAVVAYIRALQLSQSAGIADVPQPEMQKLSGRNR